MSRVRVYSCQHITLFLPQLQRHMFGLDKPFAVHNKRVEREKEGIIAAVFQQTPPLDNLSSRARNPHPCARILPHQLQTLEPMTNHATTVAHNSCPRGLPQPKTCLHAVSITMCTTLLKNAATRPQTLDHALDRRAQWSSCVARCWVLLSWFLFNVMHIAHFLLFLCVHRLDCF